jgi:hypothetical protein
MSGPSYLLSVRIAGNTRNPCLLALRPKGYKLTLWFTKDHKGDYQVNHDAQREGRIFSAATGAELLGLVAMWEVRGDDWMTKKSEPDVHDELYPTSLTYDNDGNVVEVGDNEVRWADLADDFIADQRLGAPIAEGCRLICLPGIAVHVVDVSRQEIRHQS